MWKDFSDENTARNFAEKVGGTYRKSKTTSYWVVIWDETKFDLKHFIKHCLTDEEFWQRGGIPTKEKYYIEKLRMTEEQISIFYEAMCSLQHLSKEIKQQ